jgi:serine/threonine protein phosphatase 1
MFEENADWIEQFDNILGNRYTRIDESDWNEIYVVGDIHGCIDELRDFTEEIGLSEDELLIIVGDLVRKGPDSAEVVDYVRGRDNILSVRGNNEEKLLSGSESVGLSTEQFQYLQSLPLVISWGSSVVVHGGLNESIPLEDHSTEDLLNYRSLNGDGSYEKPLWFEERTSYPRVFFGHTVLDAPFETKWAVGLDTGCVHGRGLTGYKCSSEEFVSVDSYCYEHREGDSIVEVSVDNQPQD